MRTIAKRIAGLVAIAVAIGAALLASYYFRTVRNYDASDLPNLEVTLLKCGGDGLRFRLTGHQVGPIGIIGRTSLKIDGDVAHIMLKRDLYR